MTQEEKVRAYDKAFNVALETYKTQPMYRDWLEKMFPELKESDDEKIMKALIEMVHDTTGDSLWVDYDVHKEEALAWLEKQGEQKSAWSEKDETTKNNISHIIRQYDKISKRENQPCWYVGDCLLWMQNIKDRVQPQQEWSEEDENRINRLIAYFEDKESFTAEDDIVYANWLKSLSPQSRWKPSEELLDVFIKNAIDFFESNFNPLTDGGVIGAFDDKEKMIEEFKEYMKEEGFNEEWI